MCTYNGGRYVQAQLQSIAAQTRPPDELIICDDGSEDDTAYVIRSVAGTTGFPVSLLVNDERLGWTKNFEKAISLCEGDIIALADFLAEASLPKASDPIVLDDPVNSLDHKRLEYVVDRIVTLSESSQVIVFTHDIWFAVTLLARFEKKKDECTYYDVSASGSSIGIVQPGTHPTWHTPRNLAAEVNARIEAAKTAVSAAREDVLRTAYSSIRAWCEVVVEQELFSGVTQRYQPHVAMTRLGQVKPDRLPAAIGVILPKFEKACRITEAHSQPLPTLSLRPTLSELEEDWKELQAARKAYMQ